MGNGSTVNDDQKALIKETPPIFYTENLKTLKASINIRAQAKERQLGLKKSKTKPIYDNKTALQEGILAISDSNNQNENNAFNEIQELQNNIETKDEQLEVPKVRSHSNRQKGQNYKSRLGKKRNKANKNSVTPYDNEEIEYEKNPIRSMNLRDVLTDEEFELKYAELKKLMNIDTIGEYKHSRVQVNPIIRDQKIDPEYLKEYSTDLNQVDGLNDEFNVDEPYELY